MIETCLPQLQQEIRPATAAAAAEGGLIHRFHTMLAKRRLR